MKEIRTFYFFLQIRGIDFFPIGTVNVGKVPNKNILHWHNNCFINDIPKFSFHFY